MLNEHPLTGYIGAEIDGADLRQPVAPDLAGALRDALARHQVLFRDQRQHRHHIVAQPPPQEQAEGADQSAEGDGLVEGHWADWETRGRAWVSDGGGSLAVAKRAPRHTPRNAR